MSKRIWRLEDVELDRKTGMKGQKLEPEEMRCRCFNVPLPEPDPGLLLMSACQRGSLDEVKDLIEADSSKLREVDQLKRSPLVVAMIFGHYELAKWLVLNFPNVAHRDAYRNIPIHYAIYLRSVELVQLLIDAGSELHDIGTGYSANRCLHLAMMTGSIPIAELLVKYGCSVTTPTQYGPNSLFSATLVDRLEVFQWAYSLKPSLLSAKDREGYSVFQHAIYYGSTRIVEWMVLNHGYTVARTVHDCPSGFHLAAGNGNVELCQWILQNYPDIEQHISSPKTVAQAAAERGRFAAFQLLFSHGMPLLSPERAVIGSIRYHSLPMIEYSLQILQMELKDMRSVPPLPFYSISELDDPRMLEYLFKAGVDFIDVLDDDGLNLMQSACREGKLEVAKWLYRHGMSLETNRGGQPSPVEICAYQDDIPMLKWFIQHGARISPNPYGAGELAEEFLSEIFPRDQ